MSCLKFGNVLVKRVRRRNISEREVKFSEFEIRNFRNAISEDAFYFRAEKKGVVVSGVVQRFFSDAVAGNEELVFLLVPQRKRPHAVQFVLAIGAPCFVSADNDFRVRVGEKFTA